jgi:hypothetical protein
LNNREFSSRVLGNLQFLVELSLVQIHEGAVQPIIVQVDKKDFSASRIELDEQWRQNMIKLTKELNAEIPDPYLLFINSFLSPGLFRAIHT